MKYAQFCGMKKWFLLLKAKPVLKWPIINENISQTFPFGELFLTLNFFKNVGFSVSEHCQ
jgi:hypothetical protein